MALLFFCGMVDGLGHDPAILDHERVGAVAHTRMLSFGRPLKIRHASLRTGLSPSRDVLMASDLHEAQLRKYPRGADELERGQSAKAVPANAQDVDPDYEYRKNFDVSFAPGCPLWAVSTL
jgi:hypothetical protein